MFQASKNLNLYQGEPHPVTLLVYPLTSAVAFEQTSVSSLLEGKRPVGAPVPPIPFTISPGEERLFEDSFGPATTEIGIVADFYRAPEDPEGSRLQVVPAECGWFKTTLVLSPRDIYVK
jgi:type VI secretion system VasD/TssJ family lipoprotein